jgi:hypothetical protein
MTNKNDDQTTKKNQKEIEKRSGKDRRKVHTMINPDKDRRVWNRRKKNPNNEPTT